MNTNNNNSSDNNNSNKIINTLQIAALIVALVLLLNGCSATLGCTENVKHADVNDTTRNLSYERYCDSLFITNPDYYMDVLIETDEFQDYVDKHGQWWED